jgi:hypothetical protein
MYRSSFYYAFSALVLGYTVLRMSRGLEITYETRKASTVKHLRVLIVYLGYAVLLLALYGLYLIVETEENDKNLVGDNKAAINVSNIIGLFIGCR